MGATRAFCARRGAVGEARRRGNPIGMAGAWLPPVAANVRATVLATVLAWRRRPRWRTWDRGLDLGARNWLMTRAARL